jgi:hypothetical protein
MRKISIKLRMVKKKSTHFQKKKIAGNWIVKNPRVQIRLLLQEETIVFLAVTSTIEKLGFQTIPDKLWPIHKEFSMFWFSNLSVREKDVLAILAI